MSGWSGSCPSCGAPVTFELGVSLLRVCDHCGAAVARKGANLETYGQVANLIPTPSVLKLGLSGGYEGAPRFTLAGRLQLDYGAGTWDEWLMAFADGTWSWLSESQGRFHYLGQVPLPPVPRFEELQPGSTVDLGPPGVFVAAETRSARFMSAQGELPFAVAPGTLLNYADLSGPGGQFGTLDYGEGSEAEALYVGREVTLAEMGLRPVDEEERQVKARAGSISCTQCGGPLELRAPDQTQRVACPWCGSLLDATRDFAILEVLNKVPVKPLIPLGSKGAFRGVTWAVIGFMERSVTVEGVRYPWREYLLYEPAHGFRWLVEGNGHWSYVEPVPAGMVRELEARRATYKDESFSHFQSGYARVDHVVGEFYWAVARGDQTESVDYISPPRMLSREGDQNEVNWSLGTYTTPREIQQAFRLPALPRDPVGVYAHQPWPWAESFGRAWAAALLGAAAIGFVFLLMLIAGNQRVFEETEAISPGAVSGAPEAARFVGPVQIPGAGNLQVQVEAPVDNTWVYFDGALINEATGELDEFDLEVSYYHGSDSDGSWSEGGHTASDIIPSVPAGTYTLRLAPQWEAGKTPPQFKVRLVRRVPRLGLALMAMLGLLAWPLLLSWKKFRFENARWSESDHPWSE